MGAGRVDVPEAEVGAEDCREVNGMNPDLEHEGHEKRGGEHGAAQVIHEHADDDEENVDHEQDDVLRSMC
ncbi:hypothetical protein MASR2M79_07030 [Aminivibrio sp.]